jgi:hypothetical protein
MPGPLPWPTGRAYPTFPRGTLLSVAEVGSAKRAEDSSSSRDPRRVSDERAQVVEP